MTLFKMVDKSLQDIDWKTLTALTKIDHFHPYNSNVWFVYHYRVYTESQEGEIENTQYHYNMIRYNDPMIQYTVKSLI